VPLTIRRRSGRNRVEVITPDGDPQPGAQSEPLTARCDPLTVAVARAHRWQELLDSGKYPSISALTHDLKVDFGYVSRLLQLTLLAPDIIEAILDGKAPSGLSLDKLQWRLPLLWDEQRALIHGFASRDRGSSRRNGAVASVDGELSRKSVRNSRKST
jgi:hypothetical protein